MSEPTLPGAGTAGACVFVLLSDSFADVWPQLVPAEAGAPLLLDDVAALPQEQPACVVLACTGVEDQAPGVLRELRAGRPELGRESVAVVGLAESHRHVVETLAAGADEYFVLPSELPLLHGWLRNRTDAAARRAAALARPVGEAFRGIIGESPALRRTLEQALRVLRVDGVPVLIGGETGTGKQGLAEALHRHGPRAAGRFVQVNCAAIPPTLLESELFGHEKGAFTDARSAKPGLIESANGGTLFLDEIGDLSLELQVKLLNFLDGGEVRRIGALSGRRFDVRVIAATHVDLSERVAEGRFRQDLFFRLNVLRLSLPPLRERGEDVLRLARHFVETAAREFALPVPRLSVEAEAALMGYGWPGNVRELENAIRRALIMGGEVLTSADFDQISGAAQGDAAPAAGGAPALPFPVRLDAACRVLACATLELYEGNKSRTAVALGISRKTLYSLLADTEVGE